MQWEDDAPFYRPLLVSGIDKITKKRRMYIPQDVDSDINITWYVVSDVTSNVNVVDVMNLPIRGSVSDVTSNANAVDGLKCVIKLV